MSRSRATSTIRPLNGALPLRTPLAALRGVPPLTPPPALPPARVFEERGFDFEWTVEEYGRMCEVGGGKERMTAYLNGFNGRRECVRRAATEEAARAFLSGRPCRLPYERLAGRLRVSDEREPDEGSARRSEAARACPRAACPQDGALSGAARARLLPGTSPRALPQTRWLSAPLLAQELIGSGVVPLRPGVLRVVDEAIAAEVPRVRPAPCPTHRHRRPQRCEGHAADTPGT